MSALPKAPVEAVSAQAAHTMHHRRQRDTGLRQIDLALDPINRHRISKAVLRLASRSFALALNATIESLSLRGKPRAKGEEQR